MKEIAAVIGWVAGVPESSGVAGRTFFDGPWGLVHQWWEGPNAVASPTRRRARHS